MNKLVALFCDVDDFCNVFIPQWQKQLLEEGTQKHQRESRMTTSEIMTIDTTPIQTDLQQMDDHAWTTIAIAIDGERLGLIGVSDPITIDGLQ
jgi:hypothetical protein